jgi:hypothetical protein
VNFPSNDGMVELLSSVCCLPEGVDGTFTQNNGLYGSAWTQNGGAGYGGPSDTGPHGFDSSVNSIYSSSD